MYNQNTGVFLIDMECAYNMSNIPCNTMVFTLTYMVIQKTVIGIHLAGDDHDFAQIDGAYKLLTSKDPIVKDLAWKDLSSITKHHSGSKELTLTLCAKLLSGDRFPRCNPNTSNFAHARKASDHKSVNWNFNEDFIIFLTHINKTFCD